MRNLKNAAALVGLGALLAISTGCETTKDERSEGRRTDDKHITSDVKKALKSEPTYKFDNVEVKTFAGVVQLSGFVNTQDQKERAVELTRGAGGVAQVIDSIALKPVSPTGTAGTQPRVYSSPQDQNKNTPQK
jgi:hypothetical protein